MFLVERAAYEAWKQERLAYVQQHLHRDGGWPLFTRAAQDPASDPPGPQPALAEGAPAAPVGIRQLMQKLRHAWAEAVDDDPLLPRDRK